MTTCPAIVPTVDGEALTRTLTLDVLICVTPWNTVLGKRGVQIDDVGHHRAKYADRGAARHQSRQTAQRSAEATRLTSGRDINAFNDIAARDDRDERGDDHFHTKAEPLERKDAECGDTSHDASN